MPTPPPLTDWEYRPRHVPSFVLGFFLALLGGLLLVETTTRILVSFGVIERLVPPAGRLVSLPQVEDRLQPHTELATPRTHDRRVLFLTDSVGGEGALLENGDRDATRSSLTAHLMRSSTEKGMRVVPLTADGLLLTDLAALMNVASRERFDAILILLNARMFASEFEKGEKAFSRTFLLPALPDPLRKVAFQECPDARGASVRLEAFLHRHWVTFRATQTLKTIWYHPTPKDAWTRWARWGAVGTGPRERDDLQLAALQWKVVPYYPTGPWKGLPMEGLWALLGRALEKNIPVHVVFTPQNTKFLGSDFDPAWLKKNLASLKTLKKQVAGDLHYEDWSGRFQPELFLDHCHLTPEGNERLARDLATLVTGGKP